MAFSTQRAVSDGTLVQLSLSIGYFDRGNIEVFFGGVLSPQSSGKWAWVGTTDTKINFTPAVASGVEVLVKRSTALDAPRHLYTQGAQFVADTLDENFLQMLRIAQEAKEGSTLSEIFNDLDIHGFKIKNLGAATLPGDAISLAQYQADALGAAAQNKAATASADAALASRNAASSSASSALASKDSATSSATTASNAANTATSARTAAQTAQTAAEAALDSFDDRYLGAKATAPALDNDGQALIVGAMYFDTAMAGGIMRLYSGSAWLNIPGALTGSSTQDFLAKDIAVSSQNSGQLAGMRNRIINGDMRIDQRNNGAAVNIANAGGSYPVDRWSCAAIGTGASATVQRTSDAPNGFGYSLSYTNNTGRAVVSTDAYYIYQPIEFDNVRDFAYGSSAPKTVTFSFWVKSSVAGIYAGFVRTSVSGGSRAYVFEYTINAANTWEFKRITVPGDTVAISALGSNTGVGVLFDLGSGSAQTGVLGWQAANVYRTASSVSLSATSGAVFNLTGVQLEVGSGATPFEQRHIGMELLLCQRYYQRHGFNFCMPNSGTLDGCFTLPAHMRSTPYISVANPTYSSGGGSISAGGYSCDGKMFVVGAIVSTSNYWHKGTADLTNEL